MTRVQASRSMGAGRVPGPIGLHDLGAVAKTPGPLGRGNVRIVHKPGPAGVPHPHEAPRKHSGLSYDQFKELVLRRQIARAEARGKTHFPPVAESDLETVEGVYRMRNAAAQSCKRLLTDARAALEAAQARGDSLARKTRSIGVCSAYRDHDYDAKQWHSTFKKHYDKMIKLGTFAGNEHGVPAQQHMYSTMVPKKAAPGFSNHSNGNAVDFATRHGGINHVADTDQRQKWRQTWLYGWLVQNAANYKFKQLPSEEWHWDYQ
jgi:hypothetical protein